MDSETLQLVRLFVRNAGNKARVAASNLKLNGYRLQALELENEAAMADKIIRTLSRENGQTSGYQSAKTGQDL